MTEPLNQTRVAPAAAWESLFRDYYDAYAPRLLGLGYSYFHDRHLAEEFMQQAFCGLFQLLGRGAAVEKPLHYLVATVRNQALHHMQRKKMVEPIARAEQLPIPAGRSERAEKLWGMVAQLSFEYREVVHLHVDQQLTFQEIHETLRLPLGTVEKRYYTAIQKLQELWRE